MFDRNTVHKEHTQVSDIGDALVIRDGDLTLVTSQDGDIPLKHNKGYGLYHKDCRFLSAYVFQVNGLTPTRILSNDEKGFSSITISTNPSMTDRRGSVIGKDTISIRRDRAIAGCIEETITIQNYNDFDVSVSMTMLIDSDFDDMFTVRGITSGTAGEITRTYEDGKFVLRYVGQDRHVRYTRLSFDPWPDMVNEYMFVFNLDLKSRSSYSMKAWINVEDVAPGVSPGRRVASFEETIKAIKNSYLETMDCCSNIQTDNKIFNRTFMRSLSDLRMLSMNIGGFDFYSAGVPWYDTLFGRDSIISAIQVMPYDPGMAGSTLRLLARYQGKKKDAWRDEAPGKILHELRLGEKANLGEIPQTPYFGSVDSTPLFLLMMAEYVDWTGDLKVFYDLEPEICAALDWLESNTALDPDGFLRYKMDSSFGLYNQGWKDSGDSISRSDGSLAVAPIALSEVQGYAYFTMRRMAEIFNKTDKSHDAKRLKGKADSLKEAFNRKFWMPKDRYYAIALDANGQCDVISSNPLQCLACEIVDDDKAGALVKRMFEPDMFTGWGIRTLSSMEKRYNPLGYHNGTVWPHDNSIIAMGLSTYGFKEKISPIFTGMYEAAGFYPRYRLPELFGGFDRAGYDIPIHYPVACSPQAWSAGCLPHLLTASLGFMPDALNGRLTLFKPMLPPWIGRLSIMSIALGNMATQLEFKREGESTLVNVVTKHGDIEVNVVY